MGGRLVEKRREEQEAFATPRVPSRISLLDCVADGVDVAGVLGGVEEPLGAKVGLRSVPRGVVAGDVAPRGVRATGVARGLSDAVEMVEGGLHAAELGEQIPPVGGVHLEGGRVEDPRVVLPVAGCDLEAHVLCEPSHRAGSGKGIYEAPHLGPLGELGKDGLEKGQQGALVSDVGNELSGEVRVSGLHVHLRKAGGVVSMLPCLRSGCQSCSVKRRRRKSAAPATRSSPRSATTRER